MITHWLSDSDAPGIHTGVGRFHCYDAVVLAKFDSFDDYHQLVAQMSRDLRVARLQGRQDLQGEIARIAS